MPSSSSSSFTLAVAPASDVAKRAARLWAGCLGGRFGPARPRTRARCTSRSLGRPRWRFHWHGTGALPHLSQSYAAAEIERNDPSHGPCLAAPVPGRKQLLTGLDPGSSTPRRSGALSSACGVLPAPAARGRRDSLLRRRGSRRGALPPGGAALPAISLEDRVVLALGESDLRRHPVAPSVDRHSFRRRHGLVPPGRLLPVWGSTSAQAESRRPPQLTGALPLPHRQTSPGAAAARVCGEDWYWSIRERPLHLVPRAVHRLDVGYTAARRTPLRRGLARSGHRIPRHDGPPSAFLFRAATARAPARSCSTRPVGARSRSTPRPERARRAYSARSPSPRRPHRDRPGGGELDHRHSVLLQERAPPYFTAFARSTTRSCAARAATSLRSSRSCGLTRPVATTCTWRLRATSSISVRSIA